MMSRSTPAPANRRTALLVALLAATALTLPASAWARAGGGHFGGHGGGHFGGHGFAHGRGHGHFGGAVVIGGLGLWYPAAVYASPYYGYPYAYPSAVVPAYSVPPPGQVWYYCDAAAAYYPYVTTCPGPWREVPAMPAAPGPAQ